MPLRIMLPVLLASLLSALAFWAGDSHGSRVTNLAWQAKWDAEARQLAQARAQAEMAARTEELRRQTTINEVQQHAEHQLALARADAVAAHAESGRLRSEARRLAIRASGSAHHPGTTNGRPATGSPFLVLADVLSRADQRAGELAAALDASRAAGLACEQSYDALHPVTPPHVH